MSNGEGLATGTRLEGMNARLAIGWLALGVGCTRDSEGGASSEVLQILTEHRLAVEPEGMWLRMDKEDARVLSVRRQDSGRWLLRSERMSSTDALGRVIPEPADVITTAGEMASGILVLESPLDGSTRLHLCRFGADEFLLPENTVRFEGPSARRPGGVFYERIERLYPERDVVEALPAGTWEAVDCPEWAWLEVRPTGASGEYWVRCSRRKGDDPTPVNSFARATWEAEVLAIDSPLFGNASWSLRHAKEEDWLVPVARNLAEGGVVAEPTSVRFRLVDRATRPEGHIWSWDGVDPADY
jgi:hypothetical protein